MKEKEDALKAQEQQLIEKEDEMTKMTKRMEKMQKVRFTFEFGAGDLVREKRRCCSWLTLFAVVMVV